MYIPKLHEESELSVLHALLRAHPFGTWATFNDGEILVNHLPFVLDATRGPFGVLQGHVARANPVWNHLSASVPCVADFQGVNTYITPSWYPSKHAHGKAVPTWNYVVVQARGIPQVIQDKGWLLKHLTELTDLHEHGQALPWKVTDAPADYIDKMMDAIVGIEIPVTTLRGKWKISQNRPAADRLGVVAGLMSKTDQPSRDMADLVNRAFSKDNAGP